ncbi:hypothetical protein EC957_004502 [Mortierella hygrophila]|uniref:Uncharacterized protein n=1 Tax=Mortierella hygrophila TaxID=979708 RepID=A0A9P6FF79_9FUNG|nr:hypothetical protein EC957_004502 [Mortierella hygrophila]
MHKLPKKPAGTSSAEGQAVSTNTTNDNRGRTRSHNNNNSNYNTRGHSTNRGNIDDNNNNRNISNSNRGNNNNNTRRSSNRSRGKANNNNNTNDNSNRGKNKGKRGGQRNDESESEYEEEESSTYSTDEQSEQYLDDSDTEENRAIHSLPGDFFDCDEHGQRYIWHGPAPVCSSRTAYQSSPFKLDHPFAGWQRVDEHFDMPWPPPLLIRCKSFNLSQMTQAFKAVELDINRWENILTDLWEPAVFNNERFLVLSWVITRLQYLRALYPVMDANKYDFDMRLYYDRAVLIMNTKGPDCTAVVDFISRKKEGAQEDSSVYFDKWFKNNTHFGKWPEYEHSEVRQQAQHRASSRHTRSQDGQNEYHIGGRTTTLHAKSNTRSTNYTHRKTNISSC